MKGARGRGTLEKEKPPILGRIQRGGAVVVQMLAHVQQVTIQPIMEQTIAKGTLIHTDEYDIYARLGDWGDHQNPSAMPVAKTHAMTTVTVSVSSTSTPLRASGRGSRSWLCPHRGLSQEKLPADLGVFQFVHNARRRGKALLGALVTALVA